MTALSIVIIFAALTAIVTYCAASKIALTQVKQGQHSNGSTSNPVSSIAIIAIAAHLLALSFQVIDNQGFSSSFFDALSITALIMVLAAVTPLRSRPVASLLIPVYLFAAACVLLSTLFQKHTVIVATSNGMLTHILSSIIAYSLLSIATVQALTLQLIERNLKRLQNDTWLSQLPPLQTMEVFLFQSILLGWLALTIAIVSGSIFIEDMFAQHLSHKTLFSLISWLLYGLLLIGRWRYGWRGITAVRWAISAFLALILAYFGSKFVLEILLNSPQ